MTKQQELATFLNQNITLPRAVSPYWAHQHQYMMQQRPTTEQVANELLQLAEFAPCASVPGSAQSTDRSSLRP